MKKSAEKSRKIPLWKNTRRLFAMVWKYTPSYVICMVLEGVLWGIANSLGIIYTQYLFDAIGNGEPFSQVAKIIVAYGIYLIFFNLLHTLYWNLYNSWIRKKLQTCLHEELFRQAVRIDPEKYDDPEFYNDFVWAMDEAAPNVEGTVEATGKIINRIVASLTLTAVLFGVDVWMAVLIFILSALRIVLSFWANRVSLRYREEMNPLWRKSDYINRLFLLPDYAKDLRVSQVVPILHKEFRENSEQAEVLIRKHERKISVVWFMINFLYALGECGLLILMLYKASVLKTIGLGSLAVAVNACWKMVWLLRDFSDRITKFHKHGIFVDKMFVFLDSVPTLREGPEEAGAFESLEFYDVSFSYPAKDGERKEVLSGVSFSLRRGEKIAVVGYNGAGKTTLTKLIMRLYDPDGGQILYNGRPLADYTFESLRNRMGAVFQDYRIFGATLAENVAGGVYDPSMEESVRQALRQSTFDEKAEVLKDGLDTLLTREFDKNGTQLSGGEQQKVALARAFYRNSDLIILDEPSSALDPDAEYALNRSVYDYADARTVVFISHRLSTTRHADRIYMFDSGKIAEQGTHEELMALDGKYAKMFRVQAEKYQRES